MSKEISINICGDFFINPTSDQTTYFSENVIKLFEEADYNIINLESPVTSSLNRKIPKDGPHMNGSSFTFSHLKQLKTSLVTLANNHILDYGYTGLADTLEKCREHSIGFVGAGLSHTEVRQPFMLSDDKIKVGILNFAENEFSTPNEHEYGANPLATISNLRQIREAKERFDIVIVIVHGGHEMFNLPSPRMVDLYRYFADCGASVIVSHHSHCISGYEMYNNVPIFYGLGNFLFPDGSDNEHWNIGLVLNLRISGEEALKWSLIPVKLDNICLKLSLISGTEKAKVFSDIEHYSSVIADAEELSRHWERFVKDKYEEILDIFSPLQFFNSHLLLRLSQKTGLNILFRRQKHYLKMLNHLRCESLSDLTVSVMFRYLKKNGSV